MPDFAALRKQFPVTNKYAYLNHAGIGPLSTRVTEAVDAVTHDNRDHGGINFMQWSDAVTHVRAAAAKLIGASPDEIAFVKNTSAGLILVAAGIEWKPGDNIVTAEGEFPANVYPWLFLKRVGVETRFARARDGRIDPEEIADLIDARTRLVALSWVEFATGFQNDLGVIGDICRRKRTWFCVDSIQGLGALELDVRRTPIDFMSAGGFKWLLGPMGSGIFYCRQELITQLVPTFAGWGSVVDHMDFFKYDSPLVDTARRFEESVPAVSAVIGLGAALDTFLEIGMTEIEKRVRYLTDVLIEGLQRKGYRVTSPHRTPAERSGIVTFNHAAHNLDDLEKRLTEAQVIISKRGHSIRVSPHYYNNEDDIKQLLDALP